MESLARLFGSGARLKILRLFVFNKDAIFTVAAAAERTKLTPAVARREIHDLLSAGLLRKKAKKSEQGYQVDPRFEHFAALEVFIRETTSVHPEKIVAALKRAGTLRLIALSGFFTGVIESRIDLLVAGDTINERALASTVRTLEAELGREIRYASFTTADFRYRLGVYDRLLRDVFDYPHRLLVNRIGL